ncbi:hypothetical protein GQR58_025207 [Nymphon striatum]|nr:hypothetical protein GQR58_025207 [Nymphon striatum]
MHSSKWYQAFQPYAYSKKFGSLRTHKKELKFRWMQENLAHKKFLVDLNNFCRQQRRNVPSTKCTKHFNLMHPQKFGSPGTHKKETEIPVGCQENLAHNTHFLVDLNNLLRQQRKMYPSTKFPNKLHNLTTFCTFIRLIPFGKKTVTSHDSDLPHPPIIK